MDLERWWYSIPLRLRSMFRRAKVEDELDEEFRFHLDQLIAREIARGKAAEEARRAALRAMDGIERQKEKCRDMRRVPYVENFVHDVRQAVRSLSRKPWFAASVVAVLALGIGSSTAVFSIVDAVLLRPLPYAGAERMVKIEESTTDREMNAVHAVDFLKLAARTDLFDKAVAYYRDDVTVTGAGEPTEAIVSRVSAGLFSMLGASAHLGRTLVAQDDDPNQPNVVVLSDRFWRRVFRGDPAVVGHAIRLSDEIYTVVGVMPREFEFAYSNFDLWLPIRLSKASSIWPEMVARLRPGRSISQVRSALEITAHQFEQENSAEDRGLRIQVSPWLEAPTRAYRLTFLFIFAAVGCVLMIACANVASLLLSRAVERQREMAIRASLGAGLWQVVRQLLAENCALVAAGSAIGVLMARYLLTYLTKQLARLPIPVPHLQRIALDDRVLLFNMILYLALTCLVSAAPILMASRANPQTVLRGGPAAGASKISTRLFSIFIACEAAFAFLLLAGSALMTRSLVKLEEADHGFHADHVLTMRVPVSSLRQLQHIGKYNTKPQQMAYYRELVERLHRVPGVKDLAVVNNLPLGYANTTIETKGPDGKEWGVAARTISPEYFTVMGIPLVAGRFFTEGDTAKSPGVAIVNERLAKELFPDRDPVEQKLPDGRKIVGIVRNTPQRSYEAPPEAEEYVPYQQYIFGAFLSTIVARTAGDPLAVADSLKKAVWTVDADQPIVKVETMKDVIADSIWRPRFSAWIFSVLGGLALLLSAVGIYGVVAYTSALRMREVGIRVAVGATRCDVISAIMRGAMIPLAAGLGVSFVAALLLSHLLASLLYEISSTDPVAYLGAGAVLLIIGAIASARPAWRAAVADPMRTLRAE